MKNIFLFGYYGFQNAGDEAILQGIIEQVKESIPQATLTALTYKAKDTTESYNISAVSRNHFMEIIKAIRASDIVVSGGGSILQDVTSSRSLLFYLAIIYLAKKLGKKVMFYGNGFGPITKSTNKKLVKHIVKQVDMITVRDYQSKEALQALGIKKDIYVTADVTFALEKLDKDQMEKVLQGEDMIEEKKRIGISVRPWKGQGDYMEVVAKTAEYLIGQNYEVVFIPMQYPDDLNISLEIADMMKVKPKVIQGKKTPKEVLGIISKLDILIGMRLHSLIFAAIGKVPMIGLEYDPKILSFLKLAKQKSGGKVDALDMIHLWTTIDHVIAKRDQYQLYLEETLEQLKKKSKMNVEFLKQIIEEGEVK